MTIYAWTVKVAGREDIQHVTTLEESAGHGAARRRAARIHYPRCRGVRRRHLYPK